MHHICSSAGPALQLEVPRGWVRRGPADRSGQLSLSLRVGAPSSGAGEWLASPFSTVSSPEAELSMPMSRRPGWYPRGGAAPAPSDSGLQSRATIHPRRTIRSIKPESGHRTCVKVGKGFVLILQLLLCKGGQGSGVAVPTWNQPWRTARSCSGSSPGRPPCQPISLCQEVFAKAQKSCAAGGTHMGTSRSQGKRMLWGAGWEQAASPTCP